MQQKSRTSTRNRVILGRVPATSAGNPLVAREGTLLFNGGSNYVNGELVIGGVVADGGAGQNAKIIVDGAILNCSSWFSVGRGNGIGAVSSDLVLSNAAVVVAANASAGFSGGNVANLPKGSIALNNNSSFTISGNGALNLAESPGSDMTLTLNDSAQFIASGTGAKNLGQSGKGTVNLNGSSSMLLGNATAYLGRVTGTGTVNMASSGTLSMAGELRVGGSDTSGTGRNAFGTLSVSSGTVNLGALTVGRGNNNQNQCSGDVVLNGGTMTSTNDVILGYAGTNSYGRLTISGGTFNIGPAATKWLMVGSWDFVSGVLNINSGALNLMNNTSIKMNRQTGIGGSLGGNVVNQNGGTVTFYSDAGTTIGGGGNLDLVYSGAAASSNTYNLNGGTLTVPQIACTTANGTRVFNFNGGTLRAAASSTAFMNLGAGMATANVRNSGAIIDSNGKDITIAQFLQHSDISGDAAIDGGLTKLGAGILTLSGGSSYTGPTVINGGSLVLLPGSVSYASTPVTVSNATLSVDVSGGTSLSATTMTLQNSATVSLNYGSLSANPATPAINIAGSVTAPGTGLTISVNGIGFKPGIFTMIDYTGTPLADLANFSLTLAPGLSATLSNNTANTSIDLVITTAPQNLTWYGTNANWDINTTFNFNNATLRYLEYGSGATTVGDAVRFDDTLYNDFTNPQYTNVNLTTVLSSFPVIVDSTLPYSFSGPGSLANASSLVKSNTGPLTLTSSNRHTGGTLIYGGSVIITNDNALGASASKVTLGGGNLQVNASTTNATRAVSVVASSTFGVVTNAIYQLGGVINGAGGLSKIDSGTLIVAGSNGITGNLSVDQGTLRNTGTEILPAVVRIGNTAGLDGVLSVSGGTFRAANNGGQYASSLIAGATAGSAGDIVLTGGTLGVLQQLGLGAGVGGYGALSMSGGTLSCGSYIVVGFNNDRAVYNQSSGTTTLSSNLMTIAAGGSSSIGVANISGGTFTSSFGASSGIMVGERGAGTLNVSGAAVINVPTNAGLTIGPVGTQAGWDGTLNLNGGTITANKVARGAGTGAAKLNFNGGTLKASTANTSFLEALDSATVYSGGATFDDGGFGITVSQPLLKPTDYGVGSITLSSGGSGYIDTPIVTISGGSGSNATATATVSGGVVTAVTVTCPGTGYSSSDALAVTFDSGGAAVSSAVANAPVLAANVSGGLTKKGAGTLNLTGANTYANTTTVSAGTLLVTPAHQAVGSVTVTSNAAFGVLVNTTGAATVGNLTFGSTALDKTTFAFGFSTGSNPSSPVLQCGTLTLNGTNSVRLSGAVTAGTFPIVQYTGTITGSGVFNSNVAAAQGLVATLSNYVAGSTLYVIVSGSPGIYWTGTNSVVSLANVWNLNSATNWLAAGVPTYYQETVPPGDPVTFNDIGSGVVLLSNTASPASVTISNNAVSYAFSGTGKISGTTGLTKNGSGTATLGLSGNDYTGNTVVSNGVLALGSATAIPDGASAGSVNIGTSGTLDLAGFSETINGLSGSGRIDNSSGTAAVLTMGNGNGTVTWSGAINNSGAGGNSIIKVGSGSATITGTNQLGSTAASQINGGTLLLTNNALVVSPSGELWIAQNANTGTVIVANSTLIVSNNWLVVGRNNAAANGTLIVNSGTVQKAGANNIVIGSLGATGTLIVNGGQVLNNGMLWLGENATANAYLYLNGGLLQATQVRPQGTTPANSVAYFNGGTLQATASSTNFLQVVSLVMSDGLVLDDNGFTLTINSAALQDGGGGGGLLKKGSGTVYLDVANSYTGTTVVTNGTLAGVGTIAGPVVVAPAGSIGAGNSAGVGPLTLSSQPLTIQGKAAMRISKTGGTPAQDQIIGITTVTYGGTLVISNATSDATPFALGDTFQLFSASAYTGNFTSIAGSPGSGLAYSFDPTNGVLSVVTGVASPTNITFSVSGSTLTLGWPAAYLGWYAQSNSVGVAIPGSWYDIAGSQLGTSLNVTMTPGQSNVFFRLRSP